MTDIQKLQKYFGAKLGTYNHTTGTFFIECKKCGRYDDIPEGQKNRSGEVCRGCYGSKCYVKACNDPVYTKTECGRFPSCNKHQRECQCKYCF